MSGQKVKWWREGWGIAADVFADWCGLSPATLWRIETGKTPLSVKHIKKIAMSWWFEKRCYYEIEDYFLRDMGTKLFQYGCGMCRVKQPIIGEQALEYLRKHYSIVTDKYDICYVVPPERVDTCPWLKSTSPKVKRYDVNTETGVRTLVRKKLPFDFMQL